LKFGWTPENESSYIALLSTINPLGATFGSFSAKYLVFILHLKEILFYSYNLGDSKQS
jgi:hypothetical protein